MQQIMSRDSGTKTFGSTGSLRFAELKLCLWCCSCSGPPPCWAVRAAPVQLYYLKVVKAGRLCCPYRKGVVTGPYASCCVRGVAPPDIR